MGLGDTIFLFVRGCPIGIIHHRGVTHSPPATPESERQLLRESLQNVTLRERVSKSGGAHFSSLAAALSLFLISPDYSQRFSSQNPFSPKQSILSSLSFFADVLRAALHFCVFAARRALCARMTRHNFTIQENNTARESLRECVCAPTAAYYQPLFSAAAVGWLAGSLNGSARRAARCERPI
jgi:hypothetical protein